MSTYPTTRIANFHVGVGVPDDPKKQELVFIQNTKLLYNKVFFISITVLIVIIYNLVLFSNIFNLDHYSFTLFEKEYTIDTALLNLIKKVYIISVIFIWSFISNSIFNQLKTSPIFSLSDEESNNTGLINANELSLMLGTDTQTSQPVFIPEKGLYQNILITGTIGTGKTSSAMYPLVDQLLSKNIGMLILDVKGNFYFKVQEMAKRYGKKVTVIELNGKEKYNPLDKPHLKPSVIANRIRTILGLFSNQHVTDTYWMDKVELYLTECIKLCRMYNDNYVTFVELHKLIYDKTYLKEKIEYIKDLFISQKLNYTQVYEFKTCIEFFQSEYQGLDQKVLSIIQSEISRITQIFINDLDVMHTFCPKKEEITFNGFENLKNDIVVLNMNIAEYRNLSKIIAAYLKLDFQSEILMRLANKTNDKPVAFVCDEYSEYATENDANFFSESREARCINIISTQSYTSLLNAVKEQTAAKVIIQSLVNKIWFRTDDIFTIEEAQKQLGKEDKLKYSRSISENAKETKYNYLLRTFKSENSNISESISTQIHHDFIYDFNTFSMELKTFHAICFISTGTEILKPTIVRLTPYHELYNSNKNFI